MTNEELLETAKRLITEYYIDEFEDDDVNFSNLANVGLAYSTSEDNKHEIEVCANLLDYNTEYYLDGKLVAVDIGSDLNSYINTYLTVLNFNDLIYVVQDYLDEHYKH